MRALKTIAPLILITTSLALWGCGSDTINPVSAEDSSDEPSSRAIGGNQRGQESPRQGPGGQFRGHGGNPMERILRALGLSEDQRAIITAAIAVVMEKYRSDIQAAEKELHDATTNAILNALPPEKQEQFKQMLERASGAVEQDQPHKGHLVFRMMNALQLTPDEWENVRTAVEATEAVKVAQQTLSDLHETVKAEIKAEIEKVLTTEQIEKFQQMKEHFEEACGNGQGPMPLPSLRYRG
ncbi:MAG: hypothetical protein HY709_00490 [Candidatus Latescibacteria bacterium]|nr:hypothetical protein [Candidatus Latescibacterota bacterium]